MELGRCDRIRYSRFSTPLGMATVACSETALTGLWLDGAKHFCRGLPEEAREGRLPLHDAAEEWLAAYFAGRMPEMTLPLEPEGTPFQLRVWQALRRIPYGQTCTYGALAQELGSSPRAVGGAVGRNPISILIPCHRGVGADGSLTGFAGGLERKRFLLELEASKEF